MYEFNFELNDKDFWGFYRCYSTRRPLGKVFIIILFMIIPAVIFTLLMRTLRPESGNVVYLIAFVITEVIIISAYLIIAMLFWFLVHKFCFKLLLGLGLLVYDKEQSLRFDDDSITFTTPDEETIIKYSRVLKIYKGRKGVYIFFNSLQAYILPFRIMEKKFQRNEFLSFIHQKTGV